MYEKDINLKNHIWRPSTLYIRLSHGVIVKQKQNQSFEY